jgi:hypothetical protein
VQTKSFLSFVGLALIVFPHAGSAQWMPDGAAICTAVEFQDLVRIVSDGSSGAIVTWEDFRTGESGDIYAQRIDAGGFVRWTTDGVGLCLATKDQRNPAIVSDGDGGAIVAWHDFRDASFDVYAQRVDASGAVQWTANGVALCTAAMEQTNVALVADGTGGAIAVWEDRRNGFSNPDVFAQRIDASGVVQWTANGVALCTAANVQCLPTIASDGAAGAIATWEDFRSGTTDIYSQRIDALGVVQWTANGVALCTASLPQYRPAIVSDGAGGAIVAWEDNRTAMGLHIFAQRIGPTGTVQWAADGAAVCTATGSQSSPKIISDGSNGAIITWEDNRGFQMHPDIYAQRIHWTGSTLWAFNGRPLSAAANSQKNPVIVTDGAGGAVVAWHDDRSGTDDDIYAQRVDASGSVQWTTDGVAMCTAADDQTYPAIASDDAGGAFVTWLDERGTDFNSDIYAQRTAIVTDIGDTPTLRMPAMLDNVPNPFSTTTTLRVWLPNADDVTIEVFDVTGRRVKSERTRLGMSWQDVVLEARDERGLLLPSGIYFCRVRALGTTLTHKIVVAR